MASFRPIGPKRASTTAKIRRTKVQAYGSKSDWAALSAACIKRDGNRCRQCGSPSAIGNRLNAHHIIQVAKGGKSILYNLKALCEKCHAKQPGHGHMHRH